MDVPDAAPVRASSEVVIDGPPAEVWAVLTDFAGWQRWNPDVAAVQVEGPVESGGTFRWKAGPGWITSTLQEVREPDRIVWTGTTFGIRAVHAHDLEARGDRTVVRSEESWSGLLPWLLRWPLRSVLERSLASGLGHLKAEVERRRSEETDRVSG